MIHPISPTRAQMPSLAKTGRTAIGLASLGLLLTGSPAAAQDDDGYAIDHQTTVQRCSRCHTVDAEGRMSRLSFMRKTPEGWQTSIRRMVALHDVNVSPEEARDIVRYLSNEHGLAPEELRPGLFEVERRLIDHDYKGDSGVEFTCIQCHSMGRVITQRRTEEEWGLLLATHRGLYPLVDGQAFRRDRNLVRAPADRLGDLNGRDRLRIGFLQSRIGPRHFVHAQIGPVAARDVEDRRCDQEDDDDDAEQDFCASSHGRQV